MVDILHRIGVEKSTPEKIYDALTTLDGLSGWWMEETSGSTELSGVIEFRIGLVLKVAELDPGRLVRWEVAGGPAEWVGTTIRWDLYQDGDWTIVLLKHEGWREPVEFMHHCSTKWATHLMSLKQLVETGVGTPNPHGISISNWG